jgi:glycosyltransferase involved in cell wall biosynthesis
LPRKEGKQKRIAILLPNLACGGVERVSLLLAQQFAASGLAVDLVLMKRSGELLAEVPLGCRVVSLGTNRLRSIPWRFRKYLLNAKPDAVLSAMWPLSVLAGLALRLSGLPARLVISEHNDFRKMPSIKPVERWMLWLSGPWLYGRASKVVAVSNGVRDSLREVAGLRQDRIEVIYNPIRPLNDDTVEPGDAGLIRWWQEAEFKLIAIGSLKPQKDYPTLLKALQILRRTTDTRLLALGEGSQRGMLERLAESEGLADAVRFAGFRASPQPYLPLADLFVLSSRWEGLGNVVTEALLGGCRVVATDCPSGPAELLADGRYGRLVPVGDPERLARAIAESAAGPHDPAPGTAWASRFTPEAAAKAYLALLLPDWAGVAAADQSTEKTGARAW